MGPYAPRHVVVKTEPADLKRPAKPRPMHGFDLLGCIDRICQFALEVR